MTARQGAGDGTLVHRHFSDDDLEAIREATADAERRTGGELVCVLVGRCDEYLGSLFLASTLGALAAVAAAALWHALGWTWAGPTPAWLALPAVAGAAIGFLAIRSVPSWRRALTPRSLLEIRAHRRALQAFVEEEVFATRDRTGVLLFVGLFEHHVEIVADRGVRDAVPDERWAEIAGRAAEGIRRGLAGRAVVDALDNCGLILEEHGVARRPDDDDELSDLPRISDD